MEPAPVPVPVPVPVPLALPVPVPGTVAGVRVRVGPGTETGRSESGRRSGRALSDRTPSPHRRGHRTATGVEWTRDETHCHSAPCAQCDTAVDASSWRARTPARRMLDRVVTATPCHGSSASAATRHVGVVALQHTLDTLSPPQGQLDARDSPWRVLEAIGRVATISTRVSRDPRAAARKER